ncbi:hypothetical protein L916_01559 [Phytophthora nicotianae]|uniref:Uncharacterized protein n=1 Tax=Phytophthora nicotianae TaxID=4792 RepID=W2JR66_PHYNI|nr:hypothetical protein L916_01559 [Phytophthora nicotianae]
MTSELENTGAWRNFLRSLDKTTRQLVKQRPKPKTLEEAVDKATEIDDSMDNVAQGMQNTRQSFPTAQTSHVSQAAICNDAFDYENRRNRWPGRRQVGAVLEPSGLKTRGKGKKAERKREAKQPQRKRDRSESSEVEATEKPVARKLKAAVKQVTPEDNRSGDTRTVQVLPALLSEQEQQVMRAGVATKLDTSQLNVLMHQDDSLARRLDKSHVSVRTRKGRRGITHT